MADKARAGAAEQTITNAAASDPFENLGLALSGGGIRASLFSLGVLICLVDTRKNKKVRGIASVSGGSITNAVVAHSLDFATCGPTSFEPVAKKLASRLSHHGVFFVGPFARLVILVIVGAPVLFLLTVVAQLAFGGAEWAEWGDLPIYLLASVLLFLFYATIGGGTLWFLRKKLQQSQYSGVLKQVGDVPTRRSPFLRDVKGKRVHHVFVATDLLSGRPMYFSREFVHSPAYGWSEPGRLRTARAVYASAAFPVGFPPLWLAMRGFRFQNGHHHPPWPKRLKLSDGGVYNNLGTDWFETLAAQEAPPLWAFGGVKVRARPVDHVIVVNAGAGTEPIERLMPAIGMIRRTMTVLYDNTVQPRVAAMQSGATSLRFTLIDINDSPRELAEKLQSLDGEHGKRAKALLERLDTLPPHFWDDFARQTSKTKTKLTKAGRATGARLMLHGYLSTLVLLHVHCNVPIDDIPGEERFLELAGRDDLRWFESFLSVGRQSARSAGDDADA